MKQTDRIEKGLLLAKDIKEDGKIEVTPSDFISNSLRAAFVLLHIVAVYRIVVLTFYSNLGSLLNVVNHLSMIFVILAIAYWARSYRYYRDSLLKGGVEFFSEYSFMKVLSFLAGLLCICRFVVSIVYILNLPYINTLTTVYVFFELALWFSLSIFFFSFWYDRRQRVHRLASKYEGVKI